MKKNGFTLIEIIVVIGILGIIMVMGSNLFFSILRGSTKTKILQLVKQNGDYTITVMSRMIRNAREISGNCQLGMTNLAIQNPDGHETEFSCLEIGTTNGRIASNSARITSSDVKVDSCSFTCVNGEVGVSPAAVTINFTLSQAGVTTRLEEQASVNFQTTISLRNY